MSNKFSPLMIIVVLSFSFLACSNKFADNANSSRNRNSSNQSSNDGNSSTDVNSANQSGNQNPMKESSGPLGGNNANVQNTNVQATPVNPDATYNADMQTAPDAKNAPYDLQFLDTMIAHHQSAVVMAKTAMEKSAHPELRKLAQDIVVSQEKEIDQMRELREKWYSGKSLALNMESSGMSESMHSMDVQKLLSANGNDFDITFIQMMIPHHEGALKMSQEALEKAEHPEIKTLAQAIIMSQETEIKTMQNWQESWKK